MTEPERLFFEGNRLLSEGDVLRAEASYRAALERQPDFAEAYANLGLALDRRGAPEEAEACYRRSLALAPAVPQTHMNLGGLLLARKRFDEAELAYRQALEHQPASPAGWSNLGVLYACSKREAEAERCYRVALTLDPAHARAQFNLSYVLLRQGRFEEGWQRFEARDWYSALEARLAFPRWRGEPLAGKRVLIVCDAGFGDVIQFARYTMLMHAAGAGITLLCQPALKRLLTELDGVAQVLGLDDVLPAGAWDCWTPFLSLPFHHGTRLDTIPARVPYLRAQPERVAHWAARLPEGVMRVGLAWKGNARFENDDQRSIAALSTLAALGGSEGVCFVSLQKGRDEHEADRPPPGMTMINPAPELSDFADTAALIANLDLVISVDTAVAHLTGALGKLCWLLLPDYKTDWRWLTERSDSPWYPGVMRLFRQSTRGDWLEPLAEVRAALAELAGELQCRR